MIPACGVQEHGTENPFQCALGTRLGQAITVTNLGNRDGLLLHSLVNGHPIVLSHLQERHHVRPLPSVQ